MTPTASVGFPKPMPISVILLKDSELTGALLLTVMVYYGKRAQIQWKRLIGKGMGGFHMQDLHCPQDVLIFAFPVYMCFFPGDYYWEFIA